MMCSVLLLKKNTSNSTEEILKEIMAVADFFKITRGKNTPVIVNSVNQFLQGLEEMNIKTKELLEIELSSRRDKFNTSSIENKNKIAFIGSNLFAPYKTILPFDYSSSMLAILEELAHQNNYKHLIITESRDLDGGRPIVKEAIKMGHSVTFIIDMSLMNHLCEVDAILFGAETINIDGSCYNTVGSLVVSSLAKMYNIPLFVASELSKLDTKTVHGNYKDIKKKNYKYILDEQKEFESNDICFSSKDLDLIPYSHITSYITEFGIIPPASIITEAKTHQFI